VVVQTELQRDSRKRVFPYAIVRPVSGYPLLLIHGWPETKRIWWRNIEPLAAAGFEVIVPDLRGFGDSDLAPDGHYDIASHARDLHALVHDVPSSAPLVQHHLANRRAAARGGRASSKIFLPLRTAAGIRGDH
jgi:pimeloyl-ACP methyl ester carboxylesterase